VEEFAIDMSRDQQFHACKLSSRCSSKLHSSVVDVELSKCGGHRNVKDFAVDMSRAQHSTVAWM
jgi:hypothetical protein